MPNLFDLDPNQFLGFFLIFSRLSGVLVTAPILGEETIPMQVKVGMALLISLVFYPVVAAPQLPRNPEILQLVLLVSGEVAVGLMIGFSARILLAGISMAGEVAGFQMGLGMANVFDPTTAQQVPMIGKIMALFATLILVQMDGHLLFIRALADSYQLITPGHLHLSQGAYDYYTRLTGELFIIGLRVGAPLVVSLLAANFAIGLVARSVPQMNVFVVGLPFTIGLGVMLMAIGFPFFAAAVQGVFSRLEPVIYNGLKLIGGS